MPITRRKAKAPSALASAFSNHATLTWTGIAVIAMAAVAGFLFGPSLVRYLKMIFM